MRSRPRRFLRFARALALASGVGALPGCFASHVREAEDAAARSEDAGGRPRDAARPDSPIDAPDPCVTCVSCSDPTCDPICCLPGPLPPPELPAHSP